MTRSDLTHLAESDRRLHPTPEAAWCAFRDTAARDEERREQELARAREALHTAEMALAASNCEAQDGQ